MQPVGCEVEAARLQRAFASCERELADGVEDDVIRLAVLGEVFPRVVDNPVRANRPDDVSIPRAADGCDVCSECSGNLHRKRADAARRTIDQDILPRLHPSVVANGLERGEGGHGHGRGCLKGHVEGFAHDRSVLRETHVLGEGSRSATEYLVAGPQLRNAFANRFNGPGEVNAQHFEFRFQAAGQHARGILHSRQREEINRIYRRGVNAYQYAVIRDARLVDFRHPEDIR